MNTIVIETKIEPHGIKAKNIISVTEVKTFTQKPKSTNLN